MCAGSIHLSPSVLWERLQLPVTLNWIRGYTEFLDGHNIIICNRQLLLVELFSVLYSVSEKLFFKRAFRL